MGSDAGPGAGGGEGGVGSGDLLIVGLGNPGADYAQSRHNLGARVVSELAGRLGTSVDRKRWRSLVGRAERVGGGAGPSIGPRDRIWMVLPQTYMNESGRAVKAALADTGVGLDRLWIVHDELDLPLCRLRIRRGGSAAGHNGLRSIIAAAGGDDFVRFRIGVGKPLSSALGAHHVLGGFARRELPLVQQVVAVSADALETAIRSGVEAAMGLYNRAGALGCEEID